MSTKNIIIWIVILIIVIGGGYFIYSKTATPAPADTNGTAATSTDQVQAQEVTVGTGAEATPGSNVQVLYVGKFSDGTVFDSSEAHGNVPLSFVLGATTGDVVPIAGFQIGVNGMKVGGERVLAIPPSLGYGSQDVKDSTGKVIIPANSTLIFDVKLVNVAAASSSAGTTASTTAQ
jgi:FKBP-type peptidyl-prolyl cis-trans isomerase